METKLNTFYDVQQLLKKFGFIIYFDDKEDMLEMIEQELKSLFKHQLITREQFLQSRHIVNERRLNRL
ncbi:MULTISPECIES: YqgQ family protein [unclassified Staphylococcus]|uniref:YqgQ family protein n=1 Tax=unclassified Staphylococcus TaxID=91994 RepID=UPI0021CE12E6|nr:MULTISPECIES: YqgQ family protein [unclassified Staphylococcus]UXR79321.1 YqgQ family protein [Staphylococcus sp. IVB6227]UXR81572.1 YqgQ family protein [Staphylococcus sp. IVB6214]